MKRILCVVTCHSYKYKDGDTGAAHNNGEQKDRSGAIRRTWYNTWKEKYQDQIDLKFFYGQSPDDRVPGDNEIFLDCPDDYPNLPLKVKAVFKWCVENEYDFAGKLDDDVFVYLKKLLAEFNPKDYQGYSNGWFVSGAFYWISNRAMRLVMDAPWSPEQWAEDQYCGRILGQHGIAPEHDDRFIFCHCPECLKKFPQDSRITLHTPNPALMYELFKLEK